MVGSDGAVLGIDKALSSVEAARRRVASLGVKNARLEESDLAIFETDQKFDAIVGRLVLLYLPNPVRVLRRLSRHLRPGGIVALQEFDMSQVSQTPASELFMRARRWIIEAFTTGGAEPGTVTIAGKLGLDVPPGTLNSILKQSGLKRS